MDAVPSLLTFEEFSLDLRNRRLSRHGQPIALGSRYFDALVLLVRERGALVTKDRFLAEVWGGIPVTDEALTQCIRTLRRALGDESAAPRFIATVPKHGYRFVAPVAAVSTNGSEPGVALPPQQWLTGAMASWSAAGGMAAGALGGTLYGVLTASPGGLAVLAILGAALGFLGGAGVGIGMAVARALCPRKAWVQSIGGAAGGMMVGALGGSVGRDGVALLAGARLGPVTGIAEGLILGSAAGLAWWLGEGRHRRLALTRAAWLGLAAGGLITLSGGRLFGGSLLTMEDGVAASQLGLAAALGSLGGWLAPLEGLVFLIGVTAALLHWSGKEKGRQG